MCCWGVCWERKQGWEAGEGEELTLMILRGVWGYKFHGGEVQVTHGDARAVQMTLSMAEGGLLGTGAVGLLEDVEVTLVHTHNLSIGYVGGVPNRPWGLELGGKCLDWRHHLEPWACGQIKSCSWMRW